MSIRSNAHFNDRLDRILSNKVEEKKVHIAKQTHSNLRFAMIPVSVAGMFFLLKAAALTHSGVPFVAPPGETATAFARVHHWFAGADPVTRVLASALGGPAGSQQIRQARAPAPVSGPTRTTTSTAPVAPALPTRSQPSETEPSPAPRRAPSGTNQSPLIRADVAALLSETKS